MRFLPAAEIDVELFADRVAIRARDDAEIRAYEPVAYFPLAQASGWGRALRPWGGVVPLALGGDPRPPEGYVEVSLFEAGAAVPSGMTKEACLASFFFLALSRVINKRVFKVKPRVSVRGIARLESVFAGYQEPLVRRALLAAGAEEVEFVP